MLLHECVFFVRNVSNILPRKNVHQIILIKKPKAFSAQGVNGL